MSKSIRLHKEYGVNPRMTSCPRCGGDGRDLILLGAEDTKYTCQACGMIHFGRPDRGACMREGCDSRMFETVKIGEHEKIPSSLCGACEKEVSEHKAVVEAGGVYWRCSDCGRNGVIKPNSFTEAVRGVHGTEAPSPCGVEFTKDDCPACGPHGLSPERESGEAPEA